MSLILSLCKIPLKKSSIFIQLELDANPNALRYTFFVAYSPRLPSAQEQFQRRRAESLLAKMELLEEQALTAEAEVGFWRKRHAAGYRRLIGVDPAQRHQLREGLELIVREGRQSLEELLNQFK